MRRRRAGALQPWPRGGIGFGCCTAAIFLLTRVSVAAGEEMSSGHVVMGTVLSITLAQASGEPRRETVSRAFALARHWDDVLTTWRPQGELARLNAANGMGASKISADLMRALRLMLRLSRATDGAFDPAVAPLVEALRKKRAPPPRPMAAGIAQVLTLGDDTATLRAGATLDAGAIGKGIAVDAMTRFLHSRGVDSAFVDFGGSSIAAIGQRAPGRSWSVLLVGSRPGQVLGSVTLEDAALSTSRSGDPNDPAGAIVDARRWAAVPPGRVATAIAADASSTEAWSTALVVLGRKGLAMAAEHGIRGLVADENGVSRTPDFVWAPFTQASPQRRQGGRSAAD